MNATSIPPATVTPQQATLFTVTYGNGVKFQGTVTNASYIHIKFNHVSASKVTFKKCDFSFCTFDDAYFRDSIFEDCNFTSIKCNNSNFRGAKFIRCKFKYAQFNQTILEEIDLISNAPIEANLRREFMMTLRKNAESIGDIKSIRRIIKEELRAERTFHTEAWKHKSSWYKSKYPKIQQRAHHFAKSFLLSIDRFFWGHGEHPIQFVISMILITGFFGALIYFFGIGIDMNRSLIGSINDLWRGIELAGIVFLDAPIPYKEKIPGILISGIVAFRYISIGLFTSMVFRLLSHR